jgi:hypothetical protein
VFHPSTCLCVTVLPVVAVAASGFSSDPRRTVTAMSLPAERGVDTAAPWAVLCAFVVRLSGSVSGRRFAVTGSGWWSQRPFGPQDFLL